MFFLYLIHIFTAAAVPIPHKILSLSFRRLMYGGHVADFIFLEEFHPKRIQLMTSDTREEDSYVSSGDFLKETTFSKNVECKISLNKIEKRDLKTKYFAFHFYNNNNEYFSSEVFIYDAKKDRFLIDRSTGLSWMMIGFIGAVVVLFLFIVLIVSVRYMKNQNRPIQQPDDDL